MLAGARCSVYRRSASTPPSPSGVTVSPTSACSSVALSGPSSGGCSLMRSRAYRNTDQMRASHSSSNSCIRAALFPLLVPFLVSCMPGRLGRTPVRSSLPRV